MPQTRKIKVINKFRRLAGIDFSKFRGTKENLNHRNSYIPSSKNHSNLQIEMGSENYEASKVEKECRSNCHIAITGEIIVNLKGKDNIATQA